MPQYKIPQKTQREDKIIGPLTAKQLLYAIITVVGAFIAFMSLDQNPFFTLDVIDKVVLLLPVVVLGLLFTFMEVNERPFEIYFFAFLHFLTVPKVRIWDKEIILGLDRVAESDKVNSDKKAEPAVENNVSRADIRKLSEMIDKPQKAEPMGNGPTSKTLELLNAVGKGDQGNDSMQVIAKKETDFMSKASSILTFVPNLFLGGKGKKNKQTSRPDERGVKAQNTDESPRPPITTTAASQSANDDAKAKLQQLLRTSAPAGSQPQPMSPPPPKPPASAAEAAAAQSELDKVLGPEINLSDFTNKAPKDGTK